jgi:hypothetical protein
LPAAHLFCFGVGDVEFADAFARIVEGNPNGGALSLANF